MIAALETGIRIGEILSLQWAQISTSPCAEIFIPAQKAKQKKARRVPISSRLKAILEMRRFGPDGEEQPSNAFVFGNAVGERTGTTSIDWAWKKTVLQAHGHPGEPRTYDHAYRAINLHFHDLRREAGFPLAGRRRPAAQGERLAGPLQHRADVHVPGGHVGRRRGLHAEV